MNCAFKTRSGRSCGHIESRHELDEQARSWCIPCWGTDSDELAYHDFVAPAVPQARGAAE